MVSSKKSPKPRSKSTRPRPKRPLLAEQLLALLIGHKGTARRVDDLCRELYRKKFFEHGGIPPEDRLVKIHDAFRQQLTLLRNSLPPTLEVVEDGEAEARTLMLKDRDLTRRVPTAFRLGDEQIELDKLVEHLITRTQNREGHQQFDLWVVYGSGRHPSSAGNCASVCDAVSVAEIVSLLTWEFALHHPAGRVRVRSNYDVEFLAELDKEMARASMHDGPGSAIPHILTLGLGDVNAVTGMLVEHYQRVPGAGPLHPGPRDPWASLIVSDRSPRGPYGGGTPGVGWLAAVNSPWFENRLVIAAGGVDGLGTMAATWTLLRAYIRRQVRKVHEATDERERWGTRQRGNRSGDPTVPIRLVRGVGRELPEKHWLGHDPRNVGPLSLETVPPWLE